MDGRPAAGTSRPSDRVIIPLRQLNSGVIFRFRALLRRWPCLPPAGAMLPNWHVRITARDREKISCIAQCPTDKRNRRRSNGMLVAHDSLFSNALPPFISPHDHRDRFFASETAIPPATMGPMNDQPRRCAELSMTGASASLSWSSKIHSGVQRSCVLRTTNG